MEYNDMTLEQLKDRIASDWGYGREVTDTFSEEELRTVCKSGTPYLHLQMLLSLKDK